MHCDNVVTCCCPKTELHGNAIPLGTNPPWVCLIGNSVKDCKAPWGKTGDDTMKCKEGRAAKLMYFPSAASPQATLLCACPPARNTKNSDTTVHRGIAFNPVLPCDVARVRTHSISPNASLDVARVRTHSMSSKAPSAQDATTTPNSLG